MWEKHLKPLEVEIKKAVESACPGDCVHIWILQNLFDLRIDFKKTFEESKQQLIDQIADAAKATIDDDEKSRRYIHESLMEAFNKTGKEPERPGESEYMISCVPVKGNRDNYQFPIRISRQRYDTLCMIGQTVPMMQEKSFDLLKEDISRAIRDKQEKLNAIKDREPEAKTVLLLVSDDYSFVNESKLAKAFGAASPYCNLDGEH